MDSGALLLDGTDVRSLSVRWLRSQLGLVGQEPVLFQGTVAQNIAYGKPDGKASQEEIEARRDNCTDAIKAFVKDAYADGDEAEWTAFLRMCEAFVPGRFASVPKASGRPTATEML